ncbi:hypothetical protein D046_1826A, partial [Vibrio parahaemolyticus V-223/04]
MCQLHAFKQ